MKKSLLIFVFQLSCILSFAHIVLVLKPGPEQLKDANVRTDQPFNNYGSSMDCIANAFTAQGNFFIQRSFMQFDLSQIPANAIITSAQLSLYCNTISGHAQYQYGENDCLLQRVTENWDEFSVTWDNQPKTTSQNEVFLHRSSDNTQDFTDINITDLIRDQVDNPEQSFGLMLRLEIEERYRTMVFGSSDHPDPEKRPQLVILYDTCTGTPATVSYTYSTNDSLTVSLRDQSTGINEWLWDFGDGIQSTLQNPIHTYSGSGNYIVCLDGKNACNSDSFCESISICPSAIAKFTSSTINDSIVSFSDASSFVTSRTWDFGDGTSSDLVNPVHIYPGAGCYYVCLTGENNCSSVVFCDTIKICIPVLADFTYSSHNGFTVAFVNESSYATSWFWDFDDGSVSEEQNPVHTYSDFGVYDVCLRASNACQQQIKCYSVAINPLMQSPIIITPKQGESGFIVRLPESKGSTGLFVYDLSGQMIFDISVGSNVKEVHIPPLEHGIYMFSIQTDGKMYKYKIYAP